MRGVLCLFRNVSLVLDKLCEATLRATAGSVFHILEDILSARALQSGRESLSKKKRQRKKDRQKCRHYPSVSGLFSEKLSDFLVMIFFSIQNQNKGIKLNEGCRDVLKNHHGHCHSRPFEV